MPNWSYNRLEASGQNDDVLKFIAQCKSESVECVDTDPRDLSKDFALIKRPLDFNKFIPTPKALLETVAGYGGTKEERAAQLQREEDNIKKYGFKNWYDFQVANWGTKWNACEVEEMHELDDTGYGTAVYSFATAWSPPDGVVKAMSKMFPNLDFCMECREESGEWNVELRFKNGAMTGETNIEEEEGLK